MLMDVSLNFFWNEQVRATDKGTPPLHTDTIVIVSVGAVDGNEPPVFEKDSYQISVKEHTPPDSFVIQVIHPSIHPFYLIHPFHPFCPFHQSISSIHLMHPFHPSISSTPFIHPHHRSI